MSTDYQVKCQKCWTLDFIGKTINYCHDDKKYYCDDCTPHILLQVFGFGTYIESQCYKCAKFEKILESKEYYISDNTLFCESHYHQYKELSKYKNFIPGIQYLRYDNRILEIQKTTYDEDKDITTVYYTYLDTKEISHCDKNKFLLYVINGKPYFRLKN